jgi:predicted metal-dependent phosphoesterase TrpH
LLEEEMESHHLSFSKGKAENMKNHIDLHIHSNFSNDGDFTVPQLMEKCQKASIKVMSITDHVSAKANIEAKRIAKDYNIIYITGTEIDCRYEGIDLHLLGYGIDETSPDFEALEEYIWAEERNASIKRLELTNEMGFEIMREELDEISNLKEGGIWTGEIFAEVLLAKPEYAKNELLLPYRENGARGDNPYVNFYWDFYGQGKPCYIHLNFPSLEEAIRMIHNNGGKAVLAHPDNNLKNQLELIEEMIPLGLDGIEAFCSYHDEDTTNYLYNFGLKHNLLMTAGSDFHGKTKPAVRLGGYYCPLKGEELEAGLGLYGLLGDATTPFSGSG